MFERGRELIELTRVVELSFDVAVPLCHEPHEAITEMFQGLQRRRLGPVGIRRYRRGRTVRASHRFAYGPAGVERKVRGVASDVDVQRPVVVLDLVPSDFGQGHRERIGGALADRRFTRIHFEDRRPLRDGVGRRRPHQPGMHL